MQYFTWTNNLHCKVETDNFHLPQVLPNGTNDGASVKKRSGSFPTINTVSLLIHLVCNGHVNVDRNGARLTNWITAERIE